MASLDPLNISDRQRIVVVQDRIASSRNTGQYRLEAGNVSAPVGPFKLARCILAALDQELSSTIPMFNDYSSGSSRRASDSGQDALQSSHGAALPRHGLSVSSQEHRKPQTNTIGMVPEPTLSVLTLKSSSSELTALQQGQDDSLQILIVDDNMLNLKLLNRYLLKRGSDIITTATNGIEAVDSVRQAAQDGRNFDVIFMDISMPKMDGFEATSLIRSLERGDARTCQSLSGDLDSANIASTLDNTTTATKKKLAQDRPTKRGEKGAYIVALTGLASRRDREKAKSCGFDTFLTKPFSFVMIKELLEQVSARKSR